jgi:hypothetical protein
MIVPFRAACDAPNIRLVGRYERTCKHEMGNPGSHRFPLRHGNHDVRFQSVRANRPLSRPAIEGFLFSNPRAKRPSIAGRLERMR